MLTLRTAIAIELYTTGFADISLKMIWKQICGWCVLAMISCSAAMSTRDTVTATIDNPFILNFGYSGRRFGVTYRFSKDGSPFVPERFRVFQRRGRLSFVEITDSDAGVYQLEVEGKGIHYSRTINLLGMCIAQYM